MSSYLENHTGNWVFSAYGVTVPLPADLTQRVRQPVPNRADRRRAARYNRRTRSDVISSDVRDLESAGDQQ
jgi:hypothetical protein